jgi:molybdopterin converting factor subunit 1
MLRAGTKWLVRQCGQGSYLFAGASSPRSMVAYSVEMRIRVLYFGVLKELAGHGDAMMEVAEGLPVGDLVEIHRGLVKAAIWDSVAVAVNQEYARAGQVLRAGDEVALLPPVSGGVRDES